jgi:hypothetical protein
MVIKTLPERVYEYIRELAISAYRLYKTMAGLVEKHQVIRTPAALRPQPPKINWHT